MQNNSVQLGVVAMQTQQAHDAELAKQPSKDPSLLEKSSNGC